jgi:hypothetical protein
MISAFFKALAAVIIAYTIAVSSVADFLAHQCGSFWFNYTFQLSTSTITLAFFGIFGVVVFLICMIRPVGATAHWFFWIAVAVAVLIGNSLYAQAAPVTATSVTGDPVKCALRR